MGSGSCQVVAWVSTNQPRMEPHREVHEELSLDLDCTEMRRLPSFRAKAGWNYCTHPIVISGKYQNEAIKMRKREVVRYEWFSADNLPKNIEPTSGRVVKSALRKLENTKTAPKKPRKAKAKPATVAVMA